MVQTEKSLFFPQNCHSSWQLPKLSCMSTSLDPGQPECLPVRINPSTHIFPMSLPMPGSLVPGTNPSIDAFCPDMPMSGTANISVLRTEKKYHSQDSPQKFFHCFPTSLPSPGSYLNEQKFMTAKEPSGRATAKVSGSLWKGLVIFDQSGSQTRLIYGSALHPSPYATTATTELTYCLDLHESQAIKTNPFIVTLPTLQEKFDENHLDAEESEMHEDTEELNALLYSGEEEDCDDDDDGEDEVTSTDRSPVGTKRNYWNQDHVDDIMEKVASFDGPNKRQKQSTIVDAASSVKLEDSHEHDSDTESSYAIGLHQREYTDSILRNKQSKKDKIRSILKVLEGIIPGAKGKNPLLVLDESIDYLKSLKLEAEALGVNQSHY